MHGLPGHSSHSGLNLSLTTSELNIPIAVFWTNGFLVAGSPNSQTDKQRKFIIVFGFGMGRNTISAANQRLLLLVYALYYTFK